MEYIARHPNNRFKNNVHNVHNVHGALNHAGFRREHGVNIVNIGFSMFTEWAVLRVQKREHGVNIVNIGFSMFTLCSRSKAAPLSHR
jgi:hypothetical protein